MLSYHFRLEGLSDNQAKLDKDAKKLESWLAATPARLKSLGKISASDAGNISTMRKKTDNFLVNIEFIIFCE